MNHFHLKLFWNMSDSIRCR